MYFHDDDDDDYWVFVAQGRLGAKSAKHLLLIVLSLTAVLATANLNLPQKLLFVDLIGRLAQCLVVTVN